MALPDWREVAPVAGTLVVLTVARWVWQHTRYLGNEPARPDRHPTTRYLLPREVGLRVTSAVNFFLAIPFAAAGVVGLAMGVGDLFGHERQRVATFLFVLGACGLAGLTAFALGRSGLRLWWRSGALRPVDVIDDRCLCGEVVSGVGRRTPRVLLAPEFPVCAECREGTPWMKIAGWSFVALGAAGFLGMLAS